MLLWWEWGTVKFTDYGILHRAGQWLGALKVEPVPNEQSFCNPLGMPDNTRQHQRKARQGLGLVVHRWMVV